MKTKIVQFTVGQLVLIVVGLIGVNILGFYLGARFGQDILWGYKGASYRQSGLLPGEVEEKELKELLDEIDRKPITFHEQLEGKKVRPMELVAIPEFKEPPKVQAKPEDVPTSDEEFLEIKTHQEETKPADDKTLPLANVEETQKKNQDSLSKKEIPLEEIIKTHEQEKPEKALPVVEHVVDRQEQVVQKEKESVVKEIAPQEKKDKVVKIEKLLKPQEEKTKIQNTPDQEDLPEEPEFLYTLQVGSFGSEKQALKLKKLFQSKGYSAYIHESFIPQKGKWFRVRVGRYDSSEGAKIGQGQIKSIFGMNPSIVKK